MKHNKTKHHSTGDWDFLNTDWELTTYKFYSAPSALHFKAAHNNCLVKTSTVPIASVKEGRISIQIWAGAGATGATIDVVFRYQDANNYYFVRLSFNISGGTNQVGKVVGGVVTYLQSVLAIYPSDDNFHNFRVTWWNDSVGLVIRVELWNGSTWVTWIPDGYDSNNLWKDIGGRIGYGSFIIDLSPQSMDIDDTLIYGIG